MSPSVGGSVNIDVWSIGSWTSELNDLSLRNDNGNTTWNYLEWNEENTSDSDEAYVRVDILNSSDSVIRSDLQGSLQEKNLMKLDLSVYSDVKSIDIKIKFKLYSKTKNPIVKNVVLT